MTDHLLRAGLGFGSALVLMFDVRVQGTVHIPIKIRFRIRVSVSVTVNVSVRVKSTVH